MKKKNKQIIFGMIFLISVLTVSLISSGSYSSSNPNYGVFKSYVSGSGTDDYECVEGQDFIVQIAPLGCTPSVVTSDLLEEQNVPVFCQLQATQINPLIEVDAIESISFSGDYSDGVSGIGFYPAKAALGVSGNLNSPVLENIGYVVIVLEQNKVEADMPDYVSGNLTAKISYDVDEAYGIGKATFYLPVLSDSEWDEKKETYSFWSGRGYLRAESVDSNEARIGLYNDLKKLGSVELEEGETSDEIYLPGFECQANLQLKLDSVENPDTLARLEINGEIVEVSDEQKFLDNACTIKNVEKDGLNEEVKIYCKEDDGSDTWTLTRSPRVNINVQGATGGCANEETGCEIGDILYKDSSTKKNVFLGYIGIYQGKYFVIPAVSATATDKSSFLGSFDFEVLDDYAETLIDSYGVFDMSENKALTSEILGMVAEGDDIGDGMIIQNSGLKQISFLGSKISDYIKNEGTGDKVTTFLKDAITYYSQDVINVIPDYGAYSMQFEGFATPVDEDIGSATTKEYYDKAMVDYEKLISDYGSEVYKPLTIDGGSYSVSYREEAMMQKINLAKDMGQKRTMEDLCDNFVEDYEDSGYSETKDRIKECNDVAEIASASISSRDVTINGEVKSISFKGVYEPDEEDYSAVLVVSGGPSAFNGRYTLGKGERVNIPGQWFELKEIKDDNSVIIYGPSAEGTVASNVGLTWKSHELEEGGSSVVLGELRYEVKLVDVNLNKLAKVSVIPGVEDSGTTANFSFALGIEKRAIQLSPEKTQERIDNLEETIVKWEKISDNLGTVVKTMKGACLATGAMLTIKNFIANTDGKSIARQKVMREDGGWYDKCEACLKTSSDSCGLGKSFDSIEECLLEYSDEIDDDVDVLYNLLTTQQSVLETIDETCEKDSSWEFITETKVDTNCFKINYINSLTKSGLSSDLKSLFNGDSVKCGTTEVDIDSFVSDNLNESYVSVSELQNLGLYSKSSDYSDSVKKIICDVYENSQEAVDKASVLKKLSESSGLSNVGYSIVETKKTTTLEYEGGKVNEGATYGSITGGSLVQKINYNGKKYLVVLDNEVTKSGTYGVKEVYNENGLKDGVDEKVAEEIISNIVFKVTNKESYQNEYDNPEARYYETEPYAGLPAIVPFDVEDGWYAYVRQTVTSYGSSTSSYDESAAAANYYVCNVGENGKMEEWGGDDDCTMINTGSGSQQTIGLIGNDEEYTNKVIKYGKQAIEDAARQYKSGVSTIKITNLKGNKFSVKVGNPYADISDLQCQDFMSPSDCKLLFNLCDPVICPSSRCDFGGTYPVSDVIQSGIIGSIVLCLPNYQEGIYIPVCLTGIKAGIDSLLSVYEAYRDCLQESLDSGETVGVCDEIHSIYLCEFFWKQATPIAKIVIPKILEVLLGQNVRGGGEYLGLSSAWETASNSVNYFTQYYAANSFEAFQSRTTDEVGSLVCENYVSGVYANGGDILDALTDPDSPPQFYGRFEETTFTTATVPPVSKYKVYYHIYAGEDSRVYYQVYLKSSTGSSYYQDLNSNYYVDSGYISAGEYADETADFTAVSGYDQLCIRVNDQIECGFQQATTSYAVTYVTDEYVASQAEETDITSEEDCISGTASLYSLLNLNVGSGVGELIDSELESYGITRVCATTNPGKGTDENYGTSSARWVDVGYCDDENIKCWIDKESVADAITSLDIENETISSLSNRSATLLTSEGGYLSDDEYGEALETIEKATGQTKISLINSVLDKVYMNAKKAYLYLLRALEWGKLAVGENQPNIKEKTNTADTGEDNGDTTATTPSETAGETTATPPSGEEETPEITSYNCGGISVMGGDAQIEVGEKIIEIAQSIKEEENIDDDDVYEDTGAKNFECLILQQARQESCLAHCQYDEDETDAFYCEGDLDNVVKSGGDEVSYGVMQINIAAHPSMEEKVADVTDNIGYGINYLILRYNYCKNNQNVEDWRAALNSYNGLGCTTGGDYSEKILSWEDTIKEMFPECA